VARRLGDKLLLEVVGAAFAESSRRAGAWCACAIGCHECCLGPFPINALDAWRLRDGLEELSVRDPARADAVRARALAAADQLRDGFPGDGASGVLGDEDPAEDAFCERFATMPCPALDPATRACDLYEWRPVSCRNYGPPARFGRQVLDPCRLWFREAPIEAVEHARVEPDPDDRERELLDMVTGDGESGDTLVAFALAIEPAGPRQSG
jgi:Fe-S-cluster containining protein